MNIPSNARLYRSDFLKYMDQIPNMKEDIYPSDHFFQRVVERNLKTFVSDVFIATCIAYKYFKTSSYKNRTISVSIKGRKVCFKISTQSVSGKRILILQTIFEIDDPRCYADEDLRF